MKRIGFVSIILILCSFVSRGVDERLQLKEIAQGMCYGNYVPASGLDYLTAKGHKALAEKIRAENGFVLPEIGCDLMPIVISAMEKRHMQQTDEYRLSLMSEIMFRSVVYDYENADRAAELLLDNIDRYVEGEDNKTAWRLVLRVERPNYAFNNNEWIINGTIFEIYEFLRRQPKLGDSERLLLLTTQEFGFVYGRLVMDTKEVDSMIKEIDRLYAAVCPNLPQLLEIREVYHLISKINADPVNSFLSRTQAMRLIREGTVDPYNAASLNVPLAGAALAAGSEDECRSLYNDNLRRLKELVDRQEKTTGVNASYVSGQMFLKDFDQCGLITTESDDDSERVLFESLLEELGSDIVGNRCRADAIAPYIVDRSGATVALPQIDIAQKYLEFIKDDPYLPYRYEAQSAIARDIFGGGSTDAAIELLKTVIDATEGCDESLKRARARALRNLSECYLNRSESDLAFQYMELAAECFADSKRPDYFELNDLWHSYGEMNRQVGNLAKAICAANELEELRKNFYAAQWGMETDWYSALIKAQQSNNPTKEIKRLYDRAINNGCWSWAMKLAMETLVPIEMANGNDEAVDEYMQTCFEIFRMDSFYQDIAFANEYLTYLYNYCGDRGAWRRFLAAIVSVMEENHNDLNVPFIQMLAMQADNALDSNNYIDANYCLSVLWAKFLALMKVIPSDDVFAQYSLASSIVPIFVSYSIKLLVFWQDTRSNLTEQQQRQILANGDPEVLARQYLQFLDGTIDLLEQFGTQTAPTSYVMLSIFHVRLTAALGDIESAQSELNELCEWCEANNLKEYFEQKSIGVRLDIAWVLGDMDEWVSIVDTEQFWKDIEQGHGNIDAISQDMTTLVGYYGNKSEISRAQDIAAKRFGLVRQFVDSQYMQLSEAQRAALADNNTASPRDIYWLLPRTSDKQFYTTAYEAALYYKNLLLESNNLLRSAVYNSGDSVQIADYEHLMVMKAQTNIAKLKLTEAEDRRTLRELRALEDSVSMRAFNSGSLELSRKTQMRDISRALAANEAAIEFTADGECFGALILRRGDKAPRFVRLISQQDLDECLSPLSSSGATIAPKIRRIYSGTAKRGKQLYEKLWLPLEEHLQGAERIYYSPIGSLSTVAFSAIQDSEQVALGEKYDMRLVSSTASVASNSNKNKKKQNAGLQILAIGDVNYEADSQMPKRNWLHLKNSLGEVEHFDSICRAVGIEPEILLADAASEQALRSRSGNAPGLMLLSTHGFYHHADRAAREPFYINKGLTGDNDSVAPNYNIPPLKRGGLVLAHANPVWNNEATVTDENDGILTADEISQLDLSATKLLVLSACETGLGETSLTEGINGLQRGFKLAGVQTMILSLWEVNDKAGREFMAEFFSRLFNGTERHEAFRQATLAMRNRYPNEPANWAMFVMLD